MMKLPEKFQFRNMQSTGFTHSAKVVEGKVEVKWARGYAENEGFIPNSAFALSEVEYYVRNGLWVVVEDKKVGQELPDESLSQKASPPLPSLFYFRCESESTTYKAKREGAVFSVTWDDMIRRIPIRYTEEQLVSRFKSGDWKMYKAMSLTPEQLRSNAEIQGQISALEHNVKLRKQDVEHAEILIANYEARIKDLQSKLVKES